MNDKDSLEEYEVDVTDDEWEALVTELGNTTSSKECRRIWNEWLSNKIMQAKEIEEGTQRIGQACSSCRATGYNAPTLALYDSFHGADGWCHELVQDEVDALAAAGRLWEFTHDYVPDSNARWIWKEPRVRVDAAAVNLWSFTRFGHDCVNQRICVEVRAMRMVVYGLCDICGGEGECFQ